MTDEQKRRRREAQLRYRETHREDLRTAGEKYRSANRGRVKEIQDRYGAANKGAIRERQRARYAANREAERARSRARYASDPARAAAAMKRSVEASKARDPVAWRRTNRVRSLRSRYGVTPVIFDELMIAQRCACALCARPLGDETRHIHVDHCHRTGRVRGLLCPNCNHGLGKLGDSAEGLLRALAYVRNEHDTDGISGAVLF